jgi:flagellar assembly factor FliW
MTTLQETTVYLDEGLIGLPTMREAVLSPLADYKPFFWLISATDARTRFLLVNPNEIFPDYEPNVPEEIRARLGLQGEEKPLIFSIVRISSDWTNTKINLRAPVFINPATRRAAQAILADTKFGLNESLPAHLETAEKGSK